jgi:hypothetical protein
MTTVRFYTDGERVGPLFKRATARWGDRVRSAVRQTAIQAANRIVDEGRDDISSAGRFGSRWTSALHVEISEGGGNIRIDLLNDEPLWIVFQEGRTISGKPLLWIPIDQDAKGVSARDYQTRLFRVDRKRDGLPLLLTWTKDPRVVYFGKSQVTIPKKFHLREIVAEVARNMAAIYRGELGSD